MNMVLIALAGIGIEIGFNIFLLWYMWPILSVFQYIRRHHIKIDPEQYLGIAPAESKDFVTESSKDYVIK